MASIEEQEELRGYLSGTEFDEGVDQGPERVR
jgi:hypothetical protein